VVLYTFHSALFPLSLCPGRSVEYCDEYVCLSVSTLSLVNWFIDLRFTSNSTLNRSYRSHSSPANLLASTGTKSEVRHIFCAWAAAWFSSLSTVIRSVLPVLQMTSGFLIVGPMAVWCYSIGLTAVHGRLKSPAWYWLHSEQLSMPGTKTRRVLHARGAMAENAMQFNTPFAISLYSSHTFSFLSFHSL